MVFNRSYSQHKINYLETKKVNLVDTYFGKKVPEPYQWLEDDNTEDVKEWAKEENQITRNYLDKIPFREKIKKV